MNEGKWYKKKPLAIKAAQYMGKGKSVIYPRGMCMSLSCYEAGNQEHHVHTMHDNQIVILKIGDWVVPEPDGEHFYPIKPDVFADTYEEVND